MKIINNNKKSKNSSIQFFFFTKTCTLYTFVTESIFACMKFMHQKLKNCVGGGLLFKLTCYIKIDHKIYVTKDAEKNVCMLSTILPFHY